MYPTVFDRPQWPLKPDPVGPRWYATVSNMMEVDTPRGTQFVAVAVPTGLFTLMRDVFKVPTDAQCSLALTVMDRGDEERYVFELHVHGGESYQLWDYSEDTAPGWMFTPANWLTDN